VRASVGSLPDFFSDGDRFDDPLAAASRKMNVHVN
jgi:hypothetical protein